MTVRKTLEKVMPKIYLLEGTKKRSWGLTLERRKKVRVPSKTLRKRIKESSKQLNANINRFTRRKARQRTKKGHGP